MKMPGLPHEFSYGVSASSFYSLPCSNGSVSANGFWSKHRDGVGYNQLQKFWSELSTQARQELLRIDKQTLFEQARKNMYCSRCNGLLLEGFLQIVIYAKSLPQESGNGHVSYFRQGALKGKNNGDLDLTTVCQDEVQDPAVHPWGGLTTTREGTLTLLDCYLYAKSLEGLQIVFDNARARERERELLYPDACGGGGRGWISQGISGYGRGHGTRETCALHTARLSVDTLVDFWSALGEETRQSLLRMKEEDFIERLMYRFDSKRFCRDCRRNVIREFKELKELKRMRKEPRCTSWFCVADTAFQYEVTRNSVQADWHQTFVDNIGIYHHFEWAVGTGEGKSDILEFENVGMSGKVQASGLDLGGLSACYITIRAWKMDGRCSEFSVKAHALKGQQCVHCRLVVGDGFVTITRGESIRRFFEHAEEAEEEEDDDSMDKDGNDLDGECSRPQKHAKSPELAREFLLDAATVIFKEQVEKAFREGTARQNAHNIFVCLALKMLEERVHVACKEIITLEKQSKLLEEEEKEKREEEARKERRRTKEREKKLRRKERLRVKEKNKEKKSLVSRESPDATNVIDDEEDEEEDSPSSCEQPNATNDVDPVGGLGDCPSRPVSPSIQDEQALNDSMISEMESHLVESSDGDFSNLKNDTDLYSVDHSKISHQKPKFRKGCWSETSRFTVSETRGVAGSREPRHQCEGFEVYPKSSNGWNKQLRSNSTKSNARNYGPKFGERLHYPNNRMNDRSDLNSCSSCNRHSEYRPKVETDDISKQYIRVNKYHQADYARKNCERPKSKGLIVNTFSRDSPHIKKVWEPTESLRKYPQSNDTAVMSRASTIKTESGVSDKIKLSGTISSDELSIQLSDTSHKESYLKAPQFSMDNVDDDIERCPVTSSSVRTKVKTMSGSSTSDNSSCLSEGDSNASSSSSANPESSSDSEDASQHSEGKETSICVEKVFPKNKEPKIEINNIAKEGEVTRSKTVPEYSPEKNNFSQDLPTNLAHNMENLWPNVNINSQYPVMVPSMHNTSIPFPMYQTPPSAMGYYHQSPVSWGPPAHTNGLMPFHPQGHYVYPGPFKYNLNADSYFMQYGAHLTPLLNPGQVPLYQPVARANEINSKEQTVTRKTCGAQESFGKVSIDRTVPSGQPTGKTLSGGNNMQNDNNSKNSNEGNSGFSLFHFSSPIALPSEQQLNPTVPCKDGIVEDEHACNNNKKGPIEEYNLFAANNGMRFSFF